MGGGGGGWEVAQDAEWRVLTEPLGPRYFGVWGPLASTHPSESVTASYPQPPRSCSSGKDPFGLVRESTYIYKNLDLLQFPEAWNHVKRTNGGRVMIIGLTACLVQTLA